MFKQKEHFGLSSHKMFHREGMFCHFALALLVNRGQNPEFILKYLLKYLGLLNPN